MALLAMVVGVLLPGPAQASHPTVGLGTADSFAVLAGSTVTNTDSPTVVNGDLGVSPGNAVTGFPPGVVTPPGTIHAGNAVAAQAQSDLTAAYNSAAGRACNTALTGQNLGGLTLTAGVYCFTSSAQLTGALTLDAQGDPNAVFIFQIASTLTTASESSVVLINAAQACNVFWQVGESATLGTTTVFKGSILALTTITANTGATVEDGRLLARNGAVNLDNNVITRPTCSHQVTPVVTTTPAPTGDTTGSTGTTTPRRRGRTTGGGASSTGGELPDTGSELQTAPSIATGIAMILVGIIYNHLGGSSSRVAVAFRGYSPRRRAPRRPRLRA